MSEIKVNSIKGVGASAAAITVNNTDGTCTANITNNLSNRNLVINGAMQVAQRATTNNTTGAQSTYHTLDRFMTQISVGTITESQQDLATSDTPYTLGFRKYMRILNQSGIGAATNQYAEIDQRIEAQNIAQSGWNYTSSSSYITLSFWVRASVAQAYVAVIYSQDGTGRHYPFEIKDSGGSTLSADTWTKITKTIPGDSGITVNNDNGNGLTVGFIAAYGTQFTGGSGTFNAWNTTGNGLTRWPDMTTTWATTTNATFDITGVQLEVGSVATDFEHRSYAQEYDLCRRYYERWDGTSFNPFLMGMAYQSTIGYAPFFWYPKRDVPSLEYSNISHFDRLKHAASNVSSAITNLTLTNTGPKFNYGNLYWNHDSMTGGNAILFRNSNNSGWIAISSEL